MPSALSAATAGAIDRLVLGAHRAAFAGMWIEPGEGEPGRADAKPRAEIGGGDTGRVDDRFDRQRVRNVGQRNMDGDRYGAEIGSGQHHHRTRLHAGLPGSQIGEIFGMAGKSETGVVKRFLGDRAGDDGGGNTRKHIGNRPIDRSMMPAALSALAFPGSSAKGASSGTTGSALAKTAAAPCRRRFRRSAWTSQGASCAAATEGRIA